MTGREPAEPPPGEGLPGAAGLPWDAAIRAPGGMPPGEFREWGHRLVDWVAGYLEDVGRYPVVAAVEPGRVRGGLAAEAPVRGEPMDALFEDFQSVVLPGITHWNHPAFFAYFAVSGSGPGILGELLAAALNVNAMVWKTSPAATELEQVTLDWLRGFVGLPPGFAGTINDTGLHLHLPRAGRGPRAGALPEARVRGLSDAPPRQGLRERPRPIHPSSSPSMPSDSAAMACAPSRPGRSGAWTRQRSRERSTMTLRQGFDPLPLWRRSGRRRSRRSIPSARSPMSPRRTGCGLHVDAAYAGPAAALPRMRPHFRGWERADSIVINPHKWLFNADRLFGSLRAGSSRAAGRLLVHTGLSGDR